MSRAKVRNYLSGYRNAEEKAAEIQRHIQYLTQDAYNLRGLDPTKERVQSSPETFDKIGEIIGRIDAEAEKLLEQYQAAIEERNRVVQTIYTIEDPQARSVIFNRYVDLFTWEHTAEVQGISLRWAHILEERGLDFLQNKIS